MNSVVGRKKKKIAKGDLASEITSPDEEDSQKPSANEEIVSLLVSMGFDHLRCQKAAINTSNVGVDAALTWLQSHEDDPDIDIPISEGHGSEALTTLDQSKVDHLIMFGFQEDIDRKALKASVIFLFIFPPVGFCFMI
ncbi:ubiquitin carboxyl-terminal hydrolase 14-like [Medicago truncatula]|uniref:ubiquitin carboxyl-terminal hydrolase 14-like n=1 Tax=Medicago truncatula TaxID=3880 RepID=UPI0019686038|nr:ubiquitin carboxyl-terminal hydrolase 14-like [Medicago truncatula]